MSFAKIAIIDGLLFFVIWFLIVLLSEGGNFHYVFSGIPLLAVITVFVSFRGYALAEKIHREKVGVYYAIRQGLIEGAACSSIFVLLIINNSALAAGGHLDGVAIPSWEFVQFLYEVGVPIVLAGSVFGAVHAVLFFYLNRFLLQTS